MDAIDNSDIIGSRKKRLKALCPTRWVECCESLITLKDLITVVIMLEDLSNTSAYSDVSSKANMLRCEEMWVYPLALKFLFTGYHSHLCWVNICKQDLSSDVQHVGEELDISKDLH